jgi:hypothetical protein
MASNEITITVEFKIQFAPIDTEITSEEVPDAMVEDFIDAYSMTLQDETGSVVFETSDQKFVYETMTAEIKRHNG